MLGEIALYSFIILLLTGTFLTLFFKPSMTEVVYDGSYVPLQRRADVRGLRVDAGHQLRRARRAADAADPPLGRAALRRRAWSCTCCASSSPARSASRARSTGSSASACSRWRSLEGFTGYSLPDDLLSGTGLRIAEGSCCSIPVVGTYVAFFLFGGEFPGDDLIPRLYIVHILLLPGIFLALITAHLILVWCRSTRSSPGRAGPTTTSSASR